MRIYDLKTESATDPVIDTPRPHFRWKTDGENGYFRSYYRIRVARSPERLATPDMWDSGERRDDALYVPYDGLPLKAHTEYCWCVESDGVYSSPARFETAYLSEPMPESCWIGMPMAYAGHTDIFRLDFSVTRAVRFARFYVAALGCARVRCNGDLADDGYFGGALSVYDKEVYYNTYVLTPRIGQNTLTVEVGYGFYGAKKIRGTVYLEYNDGTVCTVPTAAGRVWNVTSGWITENSIYGGERVDARRRRPVHLPAYPVRTDEFVSAYAVDAPGGKLRVNPIPPVRVVQSHPPAQIRKDARGWLVDAGCNLTGWLRISCTAKRGERIRIRYAEVLGNDGDVCTANLRTAANCDRYIACGEGEETYAPAFTYHGFRYARIEAGDGTEITNVSVEHIRTDVAETGEFDCSDPFVNALHDMARRTEENNLNGIFTDCPQRDERLGWLNDMSSRIYQSVCNFDLSAFLPNFIHMITLTQNEKGAFGDTVPFFVGSPVADTVDGYQVLANVAYKFYGDKRVLAQNYDGLCRWCRCLEQYVRDGIVEHGIYGDWCPAYPYSQGGDGTHSVMVTPAFMAGAYYIQNLEFTANAAQVLANGEEKYWREQRDKYKRAFLKRYLHKETGRLGNGSQTECAVGLTVFWDERELCVGWAETAARDIRARGYHMTCGNLGYRHLMYRLSEYGYTETVYKMLINREYPGWGFMLTNGATSVWERWEKNAETDMHSYNHPMFTGYDGFLYNYIAGIRTEECSPGFSDIVIEPCFVTGLQSVSARLETVRGAIAVQWQREGERVLLTVRTPADTRLTVRAGKKKIVYNGQRYDSEISLTNGAFRLEIYTETGVKNG